LCQEGDDLDEKSSRTRVDLRFETKVITAPLLLKARRFVVNLRQLPYDVYIGRGSEWGNRWSHLSDSKALYIVGSREEAIRKHAEWFLSQEDWIEKARGVLSDSAPAT
jgi:hypothetical protein